MTQHVLTQDNFDALLDWLDPNREEAGKAYESIRSGLIAIFNYKGCAVAEELADETINRVAGRVGEIRASYEGDPVKYFHGVGKRVYLEHLKRKPTVELPPNLEAPRAEDVERQFQCLEECLGQLSGVHRALVLQYYQERKRAKIESRRALQQALNLKSNALRVRVFRIREVLEKCVRRCLELKGWA
jgi:DNA-directed RNA polymerase specialized sigma24 family protein